MNWRQYFKILFVTCSDFTYLLRKEKCKNYGHTPILQALATVPVRVPVTEPGTGLGTGDRAWYRYRISLVVPDSGTGAKFSSGRVLVPKTYPESFRVISQKQ